MKQLDFEEFFKWTRMSRNLYDLLYTLQQVFKYLSQWSNAQFLSMAFKIGRSTACEIILDICEQSHMAPLVLLHKFDATQEIFNYHLLRARRTIENALCDAPSKRHQNCLCCYSPS